MGLDELYDFVRQPIPKNYRKKKALFEEYRTKRYQGEINSQDFLVKNEYMHDLQIAMKSQLDNRLRIFTVISAISGTIAIINFVLSIFNII